MTVRVGINGFGRIGRQVLKAIRDNYASEMEFVAFNDIGDLKTMTIHAYTNDQKILDLPHSDLRRARAAAMSIIPTTTGASKALSSVIPDLKGKFDGYALRVPISTVSIVDFTVELERETTTEELRTLFRAAAIEPRFKGILQAVDEPLVSIDYKGDPHSSSIDLQFTMALGKDKSSFVNVVTWYDNEWGYSCRTADLAALMAHSVRPNGSHKEE